VGIGIYVRASCLNGDSTAGQAQLAAPVPRNSTYQASSHKPELKAMDATKILLVIGQWLDLFDDQGTRTTPLKDPAAGGNFLPSKRQQHFVLPG
jgi:hypothetical protein